MQRVGFRAPIDALTDVEQFMTAAQQLKGLQVELRERQARESGYERSLSRQITAQTRALEELVAKHPRLKDFWRQLQSELKKQERST